MRRRLTHIAARHPRHPRTTRRLRHVLSFVERDMRCRVTLTRRLRGRRDLKPAPSALDDGAGLPTIQPIKVRASRDHIAFATRRTSFDCASEFVTTCTSGKPRGLPTGRPWLVPAVEFDRPKQLGIADRRRERILTSALRAAFHARPVREPAIRTNEIPQHEPALLPRRELPRLTGLVVNQAQAPSPRPSAHSMIAGPRLEFQSRSFSSSSTATAASTTHPSRHPPDTRAGEAQSCRQSAIRVTPAGISLSGLDST